MTLVETAVDMSTSLGSVPIPSPACAPIPFMLTDKQGVIASDRALKTLERQLQWTIFSGCDCRCPTFWNAFYNIDSHLCEPTR